MLGATFVKSRANSLDVAGSVGCSAPIDIDPSLTSKSYWGEAVMTANFLRIRCPPPSTDHGKTPYQVWTGKKPLFANLKVFGCHAYVHVPKPKRSKLDARSVHCRFIGYSDHEKRIVLRRSGLVSRDAQFMENISDSGRVTTFRMKLFSKMNS